MESMPELEVSECITIQDRFFIPSSYSRIVARELGLQERSLGKLLQGTGLPQTVLLPGDETRLNGAQQLRVLENAWRLGNVPEFGLRLGRQLQPSSHGPLGYLVLSSPDLITALKALRDFLPIRIPFAQLELELDERWLSCSCRLKLNPQPEERRLMLESFALIVQSVVESVLGRRLTEAHFCFDYERPSYYQLYPDYLHSVVEFSSTDNRIVLPADLARVSNAAGGGESYAMAQKLCLNLLDQVPASHLSMTSRVKSLLLSKPMGSITEEGVAKAMFVSKRTLARRLKSEGTGYRQINEEILSELAVRHLRESNLSVEAISMLLGYQDVANFRRAFKRWFQQTPTDFRKAGQA
ncbi:AraC family transcriptional regulator [Aestuariirhabdus sp. Z084]|uniref:AraC family transcriptional regulator n=1 Tax=Aestuariirhabdus haliotis TaxID=2918751 RepID=UPI00201B3D7D|nr:AraC family transcriptional regulator [Aestuariirhabdus haliotis]MCL6417676.1 AraC family transcriptional regulator [Aestuariirhabdus haliotis]MCL6421597.1 AraC family transcriptional regulator [Aestuariirhabdus haliotis]